MAQRKAKPKAKPQTRKTVKKAAARQAKKQARRPVKRAPLKTRPAKAVAKPRAKSKAAPKASKTAKRAAAPARKAAPMPKRKVMARKASAKTAAKPMTKPAPAAKPKALAPKRGAVPPPPATLQRERRRLPEAEAEMFNDVNGDARLMSAARAGHDELRSEMKKHTESSPEMTAGDVDAKWQDAYALGDEAPGGDNMTPDQGRVDDIGKALGIEYADDEELLGGDELIERDEHRWELNPASKDEDEEDR